MLDADLKAQLKEYLTRLSQPIELIASLDSEAKSTELRQLLEEITALNDQITYKEDADLIERKRSEEHTSELQSRGHLVHRPSFPTRRSSDLYKGIQNVRRRFKSSVKRVPNATVPTHRAYRLVGQ